MNEDEKQPGLGEVIYSVDDNEETKEKIRKREEVTEADIESFPASDPPSYSGAAADPDTDLEASVEGGQPER
ncbi:MAG: hypothetical protein M3Z20_05745 [Chloroflexota bacterium]|nr:hypothetical protein [Chloroflexota bacterium]